MTLGFLLKQLKKDVVVIEKNENIGRGRTAPLTKRAIKSINLVFGEEIWEKVEKTEFSQVTVWWKIDKFISTMADIALVDRGALLQYFRDAYIAKGGNIIFGEAFNVDETEKLVDVIDGGRGVKVRYDYLVVADGAGSLTRELLEPDDDKLPLTRMHHDYIGGDEVGSVVRDLYEMVPSGRDLLITHSYDVGYIGEAAGFADPISGETISYALKTAEEMAVAIHDEGFDGCMIGDLYGLYTYNLMREVRKRGLRRKFRYKKTVLEELFINA